MDDFSWGNARVVVEEGRDKKVVYNDDKGFDESVIPLQKFSGMLLWVTTRSSLLMSRPTRL
jgi:hypothetical protein